MDNYNQMKKTDQPFNLSKDTDYGFAGQLVSVLEPISEADPAALMVQFITMYGNVIGRNTFVEISKNQHHTNMFAVVVGKSSKARKGSSFSLLRNAIFSHVDPDWTNNNLKSGLMTGHGLAFHIRDGNEAGEPGVSDKRILVEESEFASVLRSARMPTNNLSTMVRDAWDKPILQVLTKKDAIKVTKPHVSIIAHITAEELSRELSSMDIANGFGNRFLWCYARRSKSLPFGGELSDSSLNTLNEELKKRITFGRREKRVYFCDGAKDLWSGTYEILGKEKEGVVGSLLSRAEAQVLRLSLIFSQLDMKEKIEAEHIESAIGVWMYCHKTIDLLYGSNLDNPVAEKIHRALKAEKNGLLRSEIMVKVLQKNCRAAEMDDALEVLRTLGLADSYSGIRDGRNFEHWSVLPEGDETTKNTNPDG